jgi:hypothetical protein
VASADKDVEKEKQEQSSSSKSNVEEEEDDAWTQLLIEYHKAILSTWDFAIDMGANWLKAQARMWSPDYFRGLYRQTKEKRRGSG